MKHNTLHVLFYSYFELHCQDDFILRILFLFGLMFVLQLLPMLSNFILNRLVYFGIL